MNIPFSLRPDYYSIVLTTPKTRRIACVAILAAVAGFLAGSAVAIGLYPGGQPWNRSARGYSFWHNTLSDLGKFVGEGRLADPVGSRVFDASLLVLTAGIGVLWVFLPVVLGGVRLARAARVLGLLSLVGGAGIALTPGDRYPTGHVIAIGLAAVPALLALTLTCICVLAPLARTAPATTARHRLAPRAYAAATVLLLALVLIHFGQYVACFWLGLAWTPAAPTMQKLAMMWALVWIAFSALRIGAAKTGA